MATKEELAEDAINVKDDGNTIVIDVNYKFGTEGFNQLNQLD